MTEYRTVDLDVFCLPLEEIFSEYAPIPIRVLRAHVDNLPVNTFINFGIIRGKNEYLLLPDHKKFAYDDNINNESWICNFKVSGQSMYVRLSKVILVSGEPIICINTSESTLAVHAFICGLLFQPPFDGQYVLK